MTPVSEYCGQWSFHTPPPVEYIHTQRSLPCALFGSPPAQLKYVDSDPSDQFHGPLGSRIIPSQHAKVAPLPGWLMSE
jgi:hypothetical protein